MDDDSLVDQVAQSEVHSALTSALCDGRFSQQLAGGFVTGYVVVPVIMMADGRRVIWPFASHEAMTWEVRGWLEEALDKAKAQNYARYGAGLADDDGTA
jgi:hypothetical protein